LGQLKEFSPQLASQSMLPQMQRPKQSGWQENGVSPQAAWH
jgi:hypothetical protein